MLEKTNHLSRLFDFYHKLLTDKQKDYFIMYYHKDYSLKEIASFIMFQEMQFMINLNNRRKVIRI